MDSIRAHSPHVCVQAWAGKASWAAFVHYLQASSQGWCSICCCRVWGLKADSGSALVVDVTQCLLLAGHELGRWQHAGGLHRDVHSRSAGVDAVLHLHASGNSLSGLVSAALDHDSNSQDAGAGAALHPRASTQHTKRVLAALTWTCLMTARVLHRGLCGTTAHITSGRRAAAAATLRQGRRHWRCAAPAQHRHSMSPAASP